MNHMHIYIDIKSTRSFQVNQILIFISIFSWFHRCSTGIYTTMALTTLPHPTPGCALKGSLVSASLGSPKNTSQLRSDKSILEPNTSSRCSLSGHHNELTHMSDSFLQDAIYNKIFKTMDASYAHVYFVDVFVTLECIHLYILYCILLYLVVPIRRIINVIKSCKIIEVNPPL